ncbi:MAG TPA: 50S ribosomal protein L1, partial [Spirochaetia bacterium]|nr:50S ribosomal protein L1 [Spirochaetia bacterium]
MKRGKKYIEAVKKYNQQEYYPLQKACSLAKEVAYANFDETVDLSIKLNLKKSQSVRDTVVLPHQFTGEKKILVFAKGDKAEEARQAGATYVGDSDLIDKIKDGWLDFDIAVATPDMMKDVGRLGQILGR